MNIRLEYVLTADDYREFNLAYLKHRKALTPRSMRLSPLWLVLWVVVIVVAVLVVNFYAPPAPALPPPPPSITPLKDLCFSVLPYVIIILGMWGFLWWLRRSRLLYRRLAGQGLKVDQPHMVEISDAQCTVRLPGCITIMEWTYFMRFIETKSTFLLFVLPRSAHVLPKRGFASTAQQDEFRAFALACVGNQVIGFPVLPLALPPLVDAPRSASPPHTNY